MRTTSLLLVPLLLLALPWNACSRKAHLSDDGQRHLRSGAGYFNPQSETKASHSTKRAFDE